MLLRMEDTHTVSSWIGFQELLLEKVPRIDEIIKRVEMVSPGSLIQIGEALSTPNQFNVATTRPHSQNEQFLCHLICASSIRMPRLGIAQHTHMFVSLSKNIVED